jgi:cobalt transporter subunit CbtA
VRRLFLNSALSGAVAGLLWFAVQYVAVIPLIEKAEAFESKQQDHHANATPHPHDGDEWHPADGWQRNSLTAAATVLTGIGLSAILLGSITALGRTVDMRSGLLWGIAGFLCFSAAPALGLPPLPPGVEAAEISGRQVWWLATVVLTAGGLWLITGQGSQRWFVRLLGIAGIILPHAIGAPVGPAHSVVPPELTTKFTAACLVAAALFWITLGLTVGFLCSRHRPDIAV